MGARNSSTVLALRYGQTDFPDNDTLTVDFDPSTLGFSQTFLNQMQVQKFPQRAHPWVRFVCRPARLGAINPTDRRLEVERASTRSLTRRFSAPTA